MAIGSWYHSVPGLTAGLIIIIGTWISGLFSNK